MKQWTAAFILLLLFGLMVQGAGAAGMIYDMQMNGNLFVNGYIGGNGSGLFNLNPYSLTTGTAAIDISGNAATCTTVADGGVATAGLVAGAVTAPKIGFYGRVAIVATPSGGNYDNPATAMSNYSDWCKLPPPSESNPCLLKIMPGVYTVSSPVVMQPYIDIEGSGENTTKITGALSSSGVFPPDQSIVKGANNAELRFLTVANTATGSYNISIVNLSASPSILNVTAAATGLASSNYGVFNQSSSPTMTNVTVTASGGSFNRGVFNYDSPSPIMKNVTVTASGGTVTEGIYSELSSPSISGGSVSATGGSFCRGIYTMGGLTTLINATVEASGVSGTGIFNDLGGIAKIHHSIIKGNTNTIYNYAAGPAFVGDTQLDGGPVSGSIGTLICAGAYNGSFVALGTDCL